MADAAIARLREFAKLPASRSILQSGCIEPHRLPRAGPGRRPGLPRRRPAARRFPGVTVPPYLRDTAGTRAELAELQGAIRHMDEQLGRVIAAVATSGSRRTRW